MEEARSCGVSGLATRLRHVDQNASQIKAPHRLDWLAVSGLRNEIKNCVTNEPVKGVDPRSLEFNSP